MGTSTTTPSAHIPGPWLCTRMEFDIDANPHGAFRISTEAPTHPDIADVFFRDEDQESEANALLIADAPALLTALRDLLDEADSDEVHDHERAGCDGCAFCRAKALAARHR